MLAIEEVNQLCLENLPAVTILTGDDVGQFELLKSQFYSRFVMKLQIYVIPISI